MWWFWPSESAPYLQGHPATVIRTILLPGNTGFLGTKFLQHACSSASLQDQPCCPAPGSLPDTVDTPNSRTNVSHRFSSLYKIFQGGHFCQPRNPHYAPTDYFPAPRRPSLRALTICVSWSHSLPVQKLLERLLNPWPTPTLCFNSVFYHFIILILFP